jgi:hypothetical protein
MKLLINKCKNFYLITSLFFIFFYFIFNSLLTTWDPLWLYEISLKPAFGQKIYRDYSFQHAPITNLLFEILNYFNRDNYNLFLFLGILQSLYSGYLINLYSIKIVKKEIVQKSCFLITIFTFGTEYLFLYWDAYVFLIGLTSFYLIFFTKKIYLGNFLLVTTFFLKQTFGIIFLFIYVLLNIFRFINLKKYFFLKNILLFTFFLIIYLTFITLIYDINTYYYENILSIFKIADSSGRSSLTNYLFSVFFLFPNIHNIDQLKLFFTYEKFKFSLLFFYILYRFPVIFINIYLLFNINKIKFDIYFNYLILILSSILVTPLLGRSYWGTIYFLPSIIIIFFYKNCNFNYFLKENTKKKFILIYVSITLIFFLLFKLSHINFVQVHHNYKIKSYKHFFLNIHKRMLDNMDIDFNMTKDFYNILYDNKISGIYILGDKSRVILYLLGQPELNRDLSFGTINISNKFLNSPNNFEDQLINDLKQKKPKYFLYENYDFMKFTKGFKKFSLEDYVILYKNKNYTLHQIKNLKLK